MEKWKVIIADDDQSSRTLLRHFTQILPEYEVCGEAANGEELIELAKKEDPHIALVDINMPGINGMEAVKACKEANPSLQVIFTTGYDEFAVEAFNISAADYIVKPIDRLRLFMALEKAKENVKLQKKLDAKGVKTTLTIKSNNRFFRLAIDDILFIEKVSRHTLFHTVHEQIETTDSLQEIEETLPDYFYKTHRSYIVNLNKIIQIESSGKTYMAYFAGTDKVSYISKLKINEVYALME